MPENNLTNTLKWPTLWVGLHTDIRLGWKRTLQLNTMTSVVTDSELFFFVTDTPYAPTAMFEVHWIKITNDRLG
jgi:hypothetical protein